MISMQSMSTQGTSLPRISPMQTSKGHLALITSRPLSTVSNIRQASHVVPRDMRSCARFGLSRGSQDWQDNFFKATPGDDDRARMLEFHGLMSDHMEQIQDDPNGQKPNETKPALQCLLSPKLELDKVLAHLNERVYLMSPQDIKFFLGTDETKQLLLPSKNGQFPKLTIPDQILLQDTIQALVPGNRGEILTPLTSLDPRNQVLLIKSGTTLDEVRRALVHKFPLPLKANAWREFTQCLPHKDEVLTEGAAINTWPLLDLCLENYGQQISNSHTVGVLLPIYQWMKAGQEQGVFNESDVTLCRKEIIDQAKIAFDRVINSQNGDRELSLAGQSLVKNFAVPIIEKAVLKKLFLTNASNEKVGLDSYAGSKNFTDWFNTTSPGILGFCDRDKSVSIVSPHDDNWHAIGITTQNLPLVRVKTNVNNDEIKKFLIGLGGSVIESFGLTDGMALFGSETNRNDGHEDRVFSLASLRSRIVSGFMVRAFVEPEVALAREFYNKLVQNGFSKNVVAQAKARYVNQVRETIGQLFEKTKKPMILFSVPKLFEFVDKAIEQSLSTTSLSHYAATEGRTPSQIETVLSKHLSSIDKRF